jgi:hypothetical protein
MAISLMRAKPGAPGSLCAQGTATRSNSSRLGMTQAKIMCERLLRAPNLLNLNAYLVMTGQATRASRPDLTWLI